MAIVRWDPFGEILSMQRDMERIFSRMGTGGRGEASNVAWMPKVNIRHEGDDLVVSAELPGVSPADVDVEVTDGVLKISGERSQAREEEGEGWLIRESNFGRFERSISLPEGVDPAAIAADVAEGMLVVRVPNAMKAAEPKTVKISVASPAERAPGNEGAQESPASTE